VLIIEPNLLKQSYIKGIVNSQQYQCDIIHTYPYPNMNFRNYTFVISNNNYLNRQLKQYFGGTNIIGYSQDTNASNMNADFFIHETNEFESNLIQILNNTYLKNATPTPRQETSEQLANKIEQLIQTLNQLQTPTPQQTETVQAPQTVNRVVSGQSMTSANSAQSLIQHEVADFPVYQQTPQNFTPNMMYYNYNMTTSPIQVPPQQPSTPENVQQRQAIIEPIHHEHNQFEYI
jgi:hypothetical protein